MSKRSLKDGETLQRPVKESKKHWSLGLVESMKDPDAVYKETERIVVIRDKYPKARVHYLVLPTKEISSIYKLDKTHLDLITEFGTMFQTIKNELTDVDLRAGFHAVPSMQRLHMHIISKDMDSKCLKTKIHWNSFTTSFFIPYEDLLRKLKENGCIERISSDMHKGLISTPLKCNQCSFEPKNIPQLKQHLLTHL
ncbi:jg6866 [Pararge aegeria aegeria]|uniref:Jg6866 protein n=2 Tax=Pararge aegeria TaxID=116150 RepID=A0A8S4RPG6_9NEOP|nr:jg6866 [Pararge aegeria aegeria]